MTDTGHKIYISTLVFIVAAVTIFLIFYGADYSATEMEERFYHKEHTLLKPSGLYGHGLGIIGTLLILIGVFGYMARKRFRSLSRIGVLKYWLEFHIFLCTLGPIMILFHTAFKFGGIVSISFWSMVAVVASGVIGRFIYLQIPRTIQGRELSLHEVQDLKSNTSNVLSQQFENININTLLSTFKEKYNKDYKGICGGFVVTADDAARLDKKWGTSDAVIWPLMSGKDLTQHPRERFAIDVCHLTEIELRRKHPSLYQWLLHRVKPERDTNNRKSVRER